MNITQDSRARWLRDLLAAPHFTRRVLKVTDELEIHGHTTADTLYLVLLHAETRTGYRGGPNGYLGFHERDDEVTRAIQAGMLLTQMLAFAGEILADLV